MYYYQAERIIQITLELILFQILFSFLYSFSNLWTLTFPLVHCLPDWCLPINSSYLTLPVLTQFHVLKSRIALAKPRNDATEYTLNSTLLNPVWVPLKELSPVLSAPPKSFPVMLSLWFLVFYTKVTLFIAWL